MSTIAARIWLTLRETGAAIEAELRDRIEESNLREWEAKWKPIIDDTQRRLKVEGVPRAQWPQDSHWSWRKKMDRMGGLLSGATFCIECEKATQGMMAVDTAKLRCRIKEQKDQHLVYVEYLEVAPWNREVHVPKPRFRGVGSILLIAAIAYSRHEGFKGRLGLHSLPQADQFYRKCGMTDLGVDPNYHNLRYFEMTSAQADKFLESLEEQFENLDRKE